MTVRSQQPSLGRWQVPVQGLFLHLYSWTKLGRWDKLTINYQIMHPILFFHLSMQTLRKSRKLKAWFKGKFQTVKCFIVHSWSDSALCLELAINPVFMATHSSNVRMNITCRRRSEVRVHVCKPRSILACRNLTFCLSGHDGRSHYFILVSTVCGM